MSLGRSSLLLSGTKFLEKICALAVILFAARMLGQEGVGEFFFYFSMSSMLIPLMDMGFPKVFQQRWYHNGGAPRQTFARMLLLKLLLGGLSWGILILLDRFIRPQAPNALGVTAAFAAVFFERFAELVRSPANVREKFFLEQTVPFVSRVLNLILLLTLGHLITRGYQLAWFYVISNGCGLLFSLWGIRGCRPDFEDVWKPQPSLQILRAGIPFSLTAVFVMISFYIDSVMLGRFSLAEVGAYSVAYRILLVILVISGGACQALFPRILRFRKEGREKELGWFLQGVVQTYIMFFGMIMVGGMYVGRDLIPWLFGEEFLSSGWVFVMMCPLVLLASLTNFLGQSLEAMEMQKKVLGVVVFAASFNVVANFMLIPKLGMFGAALSTVLTETLTLLLQICIVRRIPYFRQAAKGSLKSVLYVSCCAMAFYHLRQEVFWVALVVDGILAGVLFLIWFPWWPDALQGMAGKVLKKKQVLV